MSIHAWLGGARKRMLGRLLGIAAAFCLLAPAAAPAQTETDPVTALRQEIEALRQEYRERLADLEARLARLEGAGEGQVSGQEDDELAALRTAAQETAG